ncbi:MAG: anthranilate phosphoribosyltransferase [Candidatus Omnitrophica bacterium]|nr:anthranilate phosphoribosyltransferase [Candidatus Omnitrophota bacterium]
MPFEQPLSAAEMTRVLGAIMEGKSSAEEIRAFLTTLARRGETAEEIAAAVGVLRAHAVALPLSKPSELCDTCGTGGDGQGTINVSTLAALAAAAASVRIVKHGNRAASSRCGSADLLEALGVNLDASPALVARCVEEAGFGFCFAPAFHPAMSVVAPIRRELKIRTLFNLIGPLANPAPLTFQLVGVAEPRLLRPMAEALQRLGIRRGLVVHGRDGLDEVTTTTETDAVELRDGRLTARQLAPEELGVPRAALAQLRGGDAPQNARIALEILNGTPSAMRDLVAVNAGCAIYVAGRARTIPEGIVQANDAIASGSAMRVLERVREVSRHAR